LACWPPSGHRGPGFDAVPDLVHEPHRRALEVQHDEARRSEPRPVSEFALRRHTKGFVSKPRALLPLSGRSRAPGPRSSNLVSYIMQKHTTSNHLNHPKVPFSYLNRNSGILAILGLCFASVLIIQLLHAMPCNCKNGLASVHSLWRNPFAGRVGCDPEGGASEMRASGGPRGSFETISRPTRFEAAAEFDTSNSLVSAPPDATRNGPRHRSLLIGREPSISATRLWRMRGWTQGTKSSQRPRSSRASRAAKD
jgi:hypothetical protein